MRETIYFVVKNYNEKPEIIEMKLDDNQEKRESQLISTDMKMKKNVENYGVGRHKITNHYENEIYLMCADDFFEIEDKPNFILSTGMDLNQTVYGNAYLTKRRNVGEWGIVGVGMTEDEAEEVINAFELNEDGEYVFKPYLIW